MQFPVHLIDSSFLTPFSWMRDKGNLRTRGPHGLDSIGVGYYRGKELVYVARVRNGFVPASRRQVFEKLRLLVIPEYPFVNLPEKHRSRWGEGLTAEDMKKCFWVRPKLVAQIEFLEWTHGAVNGSRLFR
jgi:ATP-dependent DNA ligase